MMRNILFAILMLALLGCTMDVGYYPSVNYENLLKYENSPVQYVWGGVCGQDALLACDKLMEGVVVYRYQFSSVVACVDDTWTVMRQIPPESEEVKNAVCMDWDALRRGQ